MLNIPIITKNLLIINIIVFVATYVLQSFIDLNDLLGLHFFLSSRFHLYQLFTYMFAHAGIAHLFFNMFALWMFGGVVENVLGRNRFLFYYFVCGIGAGFMQELAQFCTFYYAQTSVVGPISPFELIAQSPSYAHLLNNWTTVGASGAVYGILLAFGMIFPEQRLFIFPIPVPIKAKYFVVLYAGIEMFSAISGSNSQVAHLAHLGGMIFGFLLLRYWRKNPNSAIKVDQMMNRFGAFTRNKGFNGTFNTKQKHQKQSGKHSNVDQEYNAQKIQKEKEVDAILDKIRRNGYDSLTKEEKQKLFEQHKS